ncbi:MAG: hypothetical protein IT453_22065 [Planctomycetes bacterium]|nr:hypothetical protein [Planctomycetota bacterium]
MKLRIATCRPIPKFDTDEAPLLAALAARGIDATLGAWHDERVGWEEPGATVIRSTWNYIHHLDAFLDWAARASTAGPFWNPLSIVRWNIHKRYLLELGARGVATTPTTLFERGAIVDLGAEVDAHGWNEFVLKPAVGAGSFGTRRFARSELADARAHLASLLPTRDMLLQPYLSSVDGYGERALVWLDGEFTHAIRKTPRWSGQKENVSTALAIEPDERALGEAALAPIASILAGSSRMASSSGLAGAPRSAQPPELLYARVDVARDASNRPVLMELELIEPSLFLAQHPPALARFVESLARRLAD